MENKQVVVNNKNTVKKQILLEKILGDQSKTKRPSCIFTLSEQSISKIYQFNSVPNIQIPEDIDIEELKLATGKRELITFVVPIGMNNAVSGNGVRYLPSAVKSLVDQVNRKRVEGFWGHLDWYEMSTRYDPPSAKWLAAVMEGDVAWGLGIALSEEAIRHVLAARATKSRIGTSILGWNVEIGEIDEEKELIDIKDYDLISIDLASAERVGIPITSAHPMVTKQMSDNSLSRKKQMNPEVVSETENIDSEVERLSRELTEKRRIIQDLRIHEQDISTARELLGLKADGDIIGGIRDLQRSRDNLAAENASLLDKFIDESIRDLIKFESARPLIKAQVLARKPATSAQVKEVLTSVVESNEVKILLEELRKAHGGDAVAEVNNHSDKTVNGSETNQTSAKKKFLKERPTDPEE